MAAAGGEVEKLDDMIVRQAEATGAQVAAAKVAIGNVIFGQEKVVEQALITAEKARLDKLVSKGALTSAQEQWLLSRLLAKVDKLVNRFLRSPVTHSIDEAHSPVPQMTHHVFHVADVHAKKKLVQHLASGTGRRILFMRTKHQARKLARQLTESGVPSVDLHGNLSQPARDRNLAAFAAGTARVLVATDIAARGVHVDGVELVVHVDPPLEHKAYLHRSGRTARAGNTGDVVTVVLPEQRKEMQVLMRRAGINVRPQEVAAHSAPASALVGAVVVTLADAIAIRAGIWSFDRARLVGWYLGPVPLEEALFYLLTALMVTQGFVTLWFGYQDRAAWRHRFAARLTSLRKWQTLRSERSGRAAHPARTAERSN